jgi:hypothetical protein
LGRSSWSKLGESAAREGGGCGPGVRRRFEAVRRGGEERVQDSSCRAIGAWSHSRVWHRKFRRKSSDSESESVAQWCGQREAEEGGACTPASDRLPAAGDKGRGQRQKKEGCLRAGPPPSDRRPRRWWSGAEGVSSQARRRPAAGRADPIVTAVNGSRCPHFRILRLTGFACV